MLYSLFVGVVVVAAVALPASASQTTGQTKPTAPGTTGDPTWQRTVQLADGRKFVTDGGLAIDAALAKPPVVPSQVIPAAKGFEEYLATPRKDEYRLGDLTASADGRTYASPSGVALSATYINFLRRILPAGSVRLRMTGDYDPVQIVASGKIVGVLMPVKK